MEREELDELQYIAHIDNISSILQRGLLSHNQARRIPHQSIAMEKIQKKRAKKSVPRGKRLHDYVNLYINARNTMLSFLIYQSMRDNLCILRVNPEVLDLPDVVVTDGNAASDYTRFHPSPDGLKYIDEDLVFAISWKHPENLIREWRHKSIMCAEVLVPDCVDPKYIIGAWVVSEETRDTILAEFENLEVDVNRHLFFL